MTDLDIRNNTDESRVEAVLDDGSVAGVAAYRREDAETWTFVHTEVDDDLEGEGVGSRLAAGVMDLARNEGFAIVPQCGFIRSYMRKHEDTHDLVAAGSSLDG